MVQPARLLAWVGKSLQLLRQGPVVTLTPLLMVGLGTAQMRVHLDLWLPTDMGHAGPCDPAGHADMGLGPVLQHHWLCRESLGLHSGR